MYEEYRQRMSKRGSFMGETMRRQSDAVVDATWLNSVAARRVQIQLIDNGLPPTYESALDFEDPIDAHFEKKSAYSVSSGESAYYLTFRPGELMEHPEIQPGAYVSIPNVDDVPEWWLIIFIEDDNELKKAQILKCNWTLKWMLDGQIYNCLGCQKYGTSSAAGDVNMSLTSTMDNTTLFFVPTNDDTVLIKYDQRFLISDSRRPVPLCYAVSKIADTSPIGITKFNMVQQTFNPKTDNVKLMIADYYESEVWPDEPNESPEPTKAFSVGYNGTKPTVKVGGSAKIFTAQLPEDNHFDIKWSLSDGVNTYGQSYDNGTQIFGDYTVTIEDRTMKVAVARNYSLIGTILTVIAECADGSVGSVKVEVIG